MSKLKLINILKNKILEQAPIGFYDTDEEPGVYYTSDEETGKIEKVDVNAIESEFYDDNETYEEDALLGYHERAKKDRDAGITNPNLISDIIKALKIANISAEIHYSRDGHDKYTANGNISRHWAGNAVDLSIIDGVGNKGGDGSNKGLCCPNSEKFMSGGDKIVDALKKLGYSFGEGSNVKGYLWRTDVGGNHWNHVHVSNSNRELKEKIKIEDKKESNKNDEKTVVFGGIGYATPTWMKSQWESAGLPTDNVIFLPYDSSELSKIKKNNKITKIVGFSAGGTDVWDEIIANNSGQYSFMGLIDPSTSIAAFDMYKNGGLPSNVKSLSNYNNWGDYPKIQQILKDLEKNKVLTHTNLSHEKIPLEFFKKYKSDLV